MYFTRTTVNKCSTAELRGDDNVSISVCGPDGSPTLIEGGLSPRVCPEAFLLFPIVRQKQGKFLDADG